MDALRVTRPDEVELYDKPWVGGTRAAAYFGPIMGECFLPDDENIDRSDSWSKAVLELLEKLRAMASVLGANSVVGVEVTLDPFALCPTTGEKGLKLLAVGTAALLEPLF